MSSSVCGVYFDGLGCKTGSGIVSWSPESLLDPSSLGNALKCSVELEMKIHRARDALELRSSRSPCQAGGASQGGLN